jgi:hypothetical protein
MAIMAARYAKSGPRARPQPDDAEVGDITSRPTIQG